MPDIDAILQDVSDPRTLREELARTLERAAVLRALIKIADKKAKDRTRQPADAGEVSRAS
jgi:hypothetical protein